MITRMLDIFFSLVGLLFLSLIYPFVALLIKFDSKGPVFYRCNRVGRGGIIFKMFKFRTMYETPVQLGPSLSPLGDPRVTPVGRFLRRLKLNEFPQFINVLKGDMTLIGPRPEAPDLAAAYPEGARKIFSVKPGLAGPNQILGRNEEEVFPPGVDPVQFYVNHILPRKLPLDVEYINNKSLFKDFKYLFLAVKVTITKSISSRHLIDNRRQLSLLLIDMVLCLVSFSVAHFLRFGGANYPESQQAFYKLLPWTMLLRLPVFLYFGFYHLIIRHLSIYDIKRVILGVSVGSMILVGFSFLSGLTFIPSFNFGIYGRSVFIMDFCALTILLIGYRIFLKKWSSRHRAGNGVDNERRVIIWGAGDAGELCLRYLQKQQGVGYQVVGFIDDDAEKRGKRINGIKVLGNRYHLPMIAKLYRIQEIYLSIPSASMHEINNMLKMCHQEGLASYFFQFKATEYADLKARQISREDGIAESSFRVS